ncbi:serine hydrolase domain-containing protein [Exilibacterium tricleocarpae]|nr:serine hydrolase domain-containing protein [Exilibacterium tricleocarpae]
MAGTVIAVAEDDPTAPAPNRQAVAFPLQAELIADGVVKGLMRDYKIPGLTLAIVKDGKPVVTKGYGYADLETGRPVDPRQSLFRIGSISKTMTWIAIMQLVEQDRIDLSADVNTYLKNVQIPHTHGVPLTLNDMMGHRSGFEDGYLGYLMQKSPDAIVSIEEVLKKHMPAQVLKPGAAMAYSNYAVALAGLIIEDVTGQPFQDYVDENLFKPLGMNHTTFREPLGDDHPQPSMAAHLQPHIASGYMLNNGRYIKPGYEYISSFAPAGSVSSTAADMARYMVAFLQNGELDGRRILKPATALKMQQRNFTDHMNVTDLSHGFFTGNVSGYQYIGHAGGTPTFSSMMTMVPELNFGVFLSINMQDGNLSSLAIPRVLVKALFPAKQTLADISPPADFSERAQRFAGHYMNNRRSSTTMEKFFEIATKYNAISVDKDGYLLRSDGTAWLEVAPLTFRNARSNDMMVFEEDENGSILRYVTDLHYGVRSAERVGFLQTPTFLYLSLGLALLLSITSLLGAWHRKGREPEAQQAWPGRMPVLAALGVMGFLVCLLFMLVQLSAYSGGVYPTSGMVLVKWVSIAVSLVLAGLAFSALPVWQVSQWRLGRKIHHSAFAAIGLCVIYALWQWNLFGPYN